MRSVILSIFIFIVGTQSFSIEASNFVRNKSDRELYEYANAMGNSLKYKLSEEMDAFPSKVKPIIYDSIGRNELALIHFSDILNENSRYSKSQRECLYKLINRFETQQYKFHNYLRKEYQ